MKEYINEQQASIDASMLKQSLNEIIKALECCGIIGCECDEKCPRYSNGMYEAECQRDVIISALDIINRQKAENERLENDLEEMADRLGVLLWHATDGMLSKSNYTTEVMVCALNDHIQECCEEAETEAIKEFAEELKESVEYIPWCDYPPVQRCIDNLVEKMERERE